MKSNFKSPFKAHFFNVPYPFSVIFVLYVAIDFKNYPKNCLQEMGIKVGHWNVEKSGKNDFLNIFQPILLAKSDKSA